MRPSVIHIESKKESQVRRQCMILGIGKGQAKCYVVFAISDKPGTSSSRCHSVVRMAQRHFHYAVVQSLLSV